MDPAELILDALAKGRDVRAGPFPVSGCAGGDLRLATVFFGDDPVWIAIADAEDITIDDKPLAEFIRLGN